MNDHTSDQANYQANDQAINQPIPPSDDSFIRSRNSLLAPSPTRRHFLTWLSRGALAAAAALGVGQLARYLSFEPDGAAGAPIAVGRPADYPAGALTYAAAARAYLGHDQGGLYAIDAVCTHLGCLVERQAGGGFACPCHGSRFGDGGQLQAGPAGQDLPHLDLQLDQDGALVLDRSHPVPAGTRLAVAPGRQGSDG